MEPLIRVEKVSKRFVIEPYEHRTLKDLLSWRNVERLERWALRSVDLEVQEGEVVGIVGPNGSGKSTLLQIIAGIMPPTSGCCIVRAPILPLLELGAGFRPDLTGEENLRLYGSLFGLSQREVNRLLPGAEEFAELGDAFRLPIRFYSSGMRARLAMAAAVSLRAPIIIIDEVLAVGDATFRERSLRRLHALQEEGRTILIVSHDLETLYRLCSRIVVLNEGQVTYDGNPQEAIWRYLQQIQRRQSASQDSQGCSDPSSAPIELEAQTLDLQGHPTSQFQYGDPLLLRLVYHFSQPIDNPIFQIQLWTRLGGGGHPALVWGTNSDRDGFRLGRVFGKGEIRIRCPSLPILQGEFFFRVGIFKHLFSTPLYLQDGLAPFFVESRWEMGGGMVYVKHEWEHIPHSTT